MLFTVAMVACDNNSVEPQPEPIFTITSGEILHVEAEGGFVPVTYTLENPILGEKVKTQILNTTMILSADTSEAGIVKIEVSPNPTTEMRDGAVIIAYANHNFTIDIKQAPSLYEVVDIAANQLIGTYYGDRLVGGLGNYWLIFSKDGIADGAVLPNTEFFRLDILGPMASDEENIVVPDGIYTFDPTNQCEEYSILNLPNTDYTYVDENLDGWSTPLDMATLKVDGNRFELVARVGAKEYHVTFEGDYSLDMAKVSDHISNLTEDVEIDVSNCVVDFGNYGDYWHCGYCNWVVEFICMDGLTNGVYLCLDLLGTTLDTSSGYIGVYPSAGFSKDDPSKPNFGPGVFVPGVRISDDGVYMQGSLYLVYENGSAVKQAPLNTGTIEIRDNGDGTQTIIIDAYDDAPKPNKLTMNWTGRLQ